jgi:hypothetical protein
MGSVQENLLGTRVAHSTARGCARDPGSQESTGTLECGVPRPAGKAGASNSHMKPPALRAAVYPQRYATLRVRRGAVTRTCTRAPRRASMSIRASVLNRSMRPRSRSLTRGWVTRRIFAAAFCLRRRDAIIFWTWIIRSARIKRCSASSRRNPRSRNTLPVEGVILTFIRDLPFFPTLHPPEPHEGPKSLPPQFDVVPVRLPAPLLERVEHVNRLRELGHVQHAMLKSRVNSNFSYSGPNRRHRLPIERVKSLLHLSELEARQAPSATGKRPDLTTRGPEPQKLPVRHSPVCKY